MQLQVQRIDPDKLKVLLTGPLDRKTVPTIRRSLLRSARTRGVRGVEIDLSEVSRIDTAGIAVMVEIFRELAKKDGKVKLTGLSENTVKMIHLSRLDSLFNIDHHSLDGS